MTSRSDTRRGFSPEGLKQVEAMVKLGYDRRTLIPSKVDGTAIFDPDLSDFINGRFSKTKPTAAEIEAEIARTLEA